MMSLSQENRCLIGNDSGLKPKSFAMLGCASDVDLRLGHEIKDRRRHLRKLVSRRVFVDGCPWHCMALTSDFARNTPGPLQDYRGMLEHARCRFLPYVLASESTRPDINGQTASKAGLPSRSGFHVSFMRELQ